MSRLHVDLLACFGVYPSAENPAAGERHGVRGRALDDGDLEIAVKRCFGDGTPLAAASDLGVMVQQIAFEPLRQGVAISQPEPALLCQQVVCLAFGVGCLGGAASGLFGPRMTFPYMFTDLLEHGAAANLVVKDRWLAVTATEI